MDERDDARSGRVADAIMHLAHGMKSIEKYLRDSESDAEHRELRHSQEHVEIRRMIAECITNSSRILDRLGDHRDDLKDVRGTVVRVHEEITGQHRIIDIEKSRGPLDMTVGDAAKGAWPYLKKAIPWIAGTLIAAATAAFYRLIEFLKGNHQ